MAIFQKAYKGYDGPLTDQRQRMLVIFRYALEDVFQSRLFAAFFALCFLPFVAMLCLLYTYYNLELLLAFDVDIDDLIPIDGGFSETASH